MRMIRNRTVIRIRKSYGASVRLAGTYIACTRRDGTWHSTCMTIPLPVVRVFWYGTCMLQALALCPGDLAQYLHGTYPGGTVLACHYMARYLLVICLVQFLHGGMAGPLIGRLLPFIGEMLPFVGFGLRFPAAGR